MGYMTVVSILNDGWHTIKDNPDIFIENIQKGMQGEYRASTVQHYPIKGFCNPMEVRRSFHADRSVLLLVGQNHMEEIADINPMRENDDFYLAYKARTLMSAEDQLEQARMQVLTTITRFLVDKLSAQHVSQGKIAETAETYEAFATLSKKDKASVLKMVEKALFKSKLEAEFK